MKYYDVFSEAGFHSAFMTTYAFSAQAFEDVPFPKLRGAGCRNIAVLADSGMLNLNFAEYGAPRYAGALYHVSKVSVRGAFHPKLTMFVGPDKGRLLVGSANLTAMGLAGNKELVADLRYTKENNKYAAIFGDAVNYLRRYIPVEDPWFEDALQRAFRYAPWLREAADSLTTSPLPDLRFLADTPRQSLIDQIQSAIGDDEIEKLIIVSPYWDANLDGLARLRKALGKPSTDVLVDQASTQFPVAVPEANEVQFFDLKDEKSSRFLHAKLIVACGKQYDHVVSGSMNCSLPALDSNNSGKGNAEVGLYKRVEREHALRKLKLNGYAAAPLSKTDLPIRKESAEQANSLPAHDGGLFSLQQNRLFWIPPKNGSGNVRSIILFNRDGEQVGETIATDGGSRQSWDLPFEDVRPRTAKVIFDTGASVPTIIVDRDALAVSTLPAYRGKRRKIIDALADSSVEDLFLLQAINELETLDLEELSMAEEKVGLKTKIADDGKEETVTKTLSYEAFIQARNRAKAEDQSNHPFLSRQQDKATDLVSLCLNRLIGLMETDLSKDDEDDLQRQAEIDLRNTEPQAGQHHEPDAAHALEKAAAARKARIQIAASAKKIEEAVKAFETRSKTMVGQRITTTELVRLRTLLQIILAYAEPAVSDEKNIHVLPIAGRDGDWPRLVGRLLSLHFKTLRALQSLQVEADENEHRRVLEYLASTRHAAQLAVAGARSSGSSNPILKPLSQLASDVDTQFQAVAAMHETDKEILAKLNEGMNERFALKLGFQPVSNP